MKKHYEINTLAEQDKALEKLWKELSDVPMDPETECIKEPFLDFPVGTHQEDIWDWFNERHSKGVDYLLYGKVEAKIDATAEQDKALEELWEKLSDVPMDQETECIGEPFGDFPAGTHREEIWHWFDERHSKGVVYLLYGGAEDYVPETKRLYDLSKHCFECETKGCIYSSDGVCRFAMVYGKEPTITEEDGCVSGVVPF